MTLKRELIFYIALFLMILMFSMVSSAFDYDLWARLIAGMGFVETGHVLTQDFLSYTPVHTWWDHEWGAGTIFYLCLKYFGAYSLIVLQAVLIFLIFFIASRIVKLRYDGNYSNILYYFFGVMAILGTLNNPVRSHLFSFLFFTLFIYIFEKARKGNDKLLFLVPVIILFWNNIHGGVVSGIGLILMYAIGELLNKKPFVKYLVTFAVSCPVLLINPWGWDYIKFLLMANTMARNDIVEWYNMFSPIMLFKYLEFKFFMLITISSEIVCMYKDAKNNDWYRNFDKTKCIVIFVTLYLAISHVKLLPFFVIVSVCFIYEDFYKLIKNVKLPEWKDKVVYLLIFLVVFITFISRDFSLPVGMDRFPVKEVEFIKINNLKGNLFANFNYGSYISYKLYPNNLIFMDGRYEEVYYDYMLPMQKRFFLVLPGWENTIESADVMIIEKTNYNIFDVLKKSKNWALVYETNLNGVFVPKDKLKTNYIMPSDDMVYYKNTLFDTSIKFK